MRKHPKFKRIISLALAAAISLSAMMLSGCSDGGTDSAESKKTVEEMRDITSFELLDEITVGWNLGNTLDAHDATKPNPTPERQETCWGNPKTTEEMILAVKDKGFNTIRVPVTWYPQLGAAPDYKINEAWLDRVQEVVDYVVGNDMYCIINLHHENWHFPSYDNLDAAKGQLIAVWTQIADRFSGYDEHLLFEGMNEPRMVGTSKEWTGGDAESRDVINQLNAAFVETIRKSGDNNPKRHLLIPTYAASSTMQTINDFIVPEDDRIIISVHAYTPYNFALNAKGTFEFDPAKDGAEIDALMQLIKDYYHGRNYPAIIGEFGARNKYNTDDRCEWASYYVSAATKNNIRCIWWDNGAFTSGEAFGLLKRSTLTWEYPEIVEAMMKARGVQ
ncbi:MAG: glycoside hydrolase family 5 protein [Ruminococcus sp.]|nr:glycoside hydrolase family 5 protein [Ruminococcus sp.]